MRNCQRFFMVVLLLCAFLCAGSVLVFAQQDAAAPLQLESAPGKLVEMRYIDDPRLINIPARPGFLENALAAGAATINVNYLPAGLDPHGSGDVCTAWPSAAQAAFEYAMSLAADRFSSSVPTTIDACWVTNFLDPAILGHSSAIYIWRDFPGAPVANTWYPEALANALSGSDLNPNSHEIYIGYNANRTDWYFGTDGLPPITKLDMVSVAFHEVFHGLGFLPSFSYSGGTGSWSWGTGYPMAYDRFVGNGSGQMLISAFPNPSAALGSQLVSDNIFFRGPAAAAANAGSYPKLYAPPVWAGGSSISHLDYATFSATELMVYAIGHGQAKHSPGPVSMGVMTDVGWATNPSSFGLTITMSKASYTTGETVTATIRFQNPGPWTACEVKVWLAGPGIAPISFLNSGADGSVVIPAGYDQVFGPIPLFTVVGGLPLGEYEFSARTLDPVTGEILNEDLNPFVIQ